MTTQAQNHQWYVRKQKKAKNNKTTALTQIRRMDDIVPCPFCSVPTKLRDMTAHRNEFHPAAI